MVTPIWRVAVARRRGFGFKRLVWDEFAHCNRTKSVRAKMKIFPRLSLHSALTSVVQAEYSVRHVPRKPCNIILWLKKTIIWLDMLVDLGFVTPESGGPGSRRGRVRRRGSGGLHAGQQDHPSRRCHPGKSGAFRRGSCQSQRGSASRMTLLPTVPRHIAKKYRVVPVFKHGNSLTVAIADPSDLATIDSLDPFAAARRSVAGGFRAGHRNRVESSTTAATGNSVVDKAIQEVTHGRRWNIAGACTA